jgi:serine/threonine protein kinase
MSTLKMSLKSAFPPVNWKTYSTNTHRCPFYFKMLIPRILGLHVEGDTLDKKEGRNMAQQLRYAQAMSGITQKHERKTNSGSQDEGLLNWRNRHGNRTLARSVVGTSQYMAPEVVRGDSYDARCDWWSVAVILYEVSYRITIARHRS